MLLSGKMGKKPLVCREINLATSTRADLQPAALDFPRAQVNGAIICPDIFPNTVIFSSYFFFLFNQSLIASADGPHPSPSASAGTIDGEQKRPYYEERTERR